MPESLRKDLNLKIGLQRLLLAAAMFWSKAQWPLSLIVATIAFLYIGPSKLLGRPIISLVLLLLLIGIIFSLRALWRAKWPRQFGAMRYLEQSAGLVHRPVSSQTDSLSEESNTSRSGELWREHQRRKLATGMKISPELPKSDWRTIDPLALRVPLAIAFLASLLLGAGHPVSELRNLLTGESQSGQAVASVEAWAKPPAYTNKPPVLLTSKAMAEKLSDSPEILLPENSVLNVRISAATKPTLRLVPLQGTNQPSELLKSPELKSSGAEKSVSGDVLLDRPMQVEVLDAEAPLGTFSISVIPDQAPTIAFATDPAGDKNGFTKLQWKASDDYGVKSVTAEISLSDQQESGLGFETNGVFLFSAPEFVINLKHPSAKTMEETSVQDLTSHAWAGLFVDVALTAEDGAGHKTTTPIKRFKLPEKLFFKPFAQALVEQRKKLIATPDNAPDVATMLQALTAYPTGLNGRSGLLLNLSALKARLENLSSPDDVVAIVDDLWPLIRAIEDGEAADVRAELRDLKRQLEQALKDGAPEERIAQLTDRMRKAMDKLMQQLSKEGQKQLSEGGKLPSGPSVSPKDLQKMLDAIEQLSKGGAKDKAEELLSQLDKMLQNMRPGNGSQAQGGSAAQDQLDALSGVMKKQQKLMDQTQRLGDGGDDPGPNGKGNSTGGELGDQQGALKDLLDQLQRGMDKETQGNLGEAGKNMGGAENDLRGGSKGQALQQQGQALQKLREGAAKLSKKLAEQNQGLTGEQSHEGQASGNNDDPLGRPSATRHPGEQADRNLIPSELAMQRAREILEELRNRAGNQSLSGEDRAYIERLLKGLY